MTFTRQTAARWRQEIPGARWFKSDLHVHTIDDHAGGRAKLPEGLFGSPEDPEVLSRYAKAFLQAVVSNRVQVVALTPHSPRVGVTAETSAVWKIVEEWNGATDDDGVPFREKIYAVFPGFEPNLMDGREGLHLLFLFDPEIGRDCYLKLFELVMGGVSPWRDRTLQISNKSAEQVFDDLKKFHDRECPPDGSGRSLWRYLILAPHIDHPKGLLGAQKAQVLQLFDHGAVAGLELGDDKLPEDTLRDRPWLSDGMRKHWQAFFHGSDAYSVSEIGSRHTWLKLASPRIEALRQAFIASESRIRIGFARDAMGGFREIDDPPDVTVNKRAWLKSVTIRGEASFFGTSEGEGPKEVRFDLSPDLTCLIGASMTGKSTLLDGLRVYVGASLPQDSSIRDQVEGRGRERFLAGSPEVTLECPGSDPTAPFHEQWPAVFFAQNELQRLSQEATAIEEILARLVPGETDGIDGRSRRLEDLDGRLRKLAETLDVLDEQLSEAEQAHDRAKRAKDELAAFSRAGVDGLHQAVCGHQKWREAQQTGAAIRRAIEDILRSVHKFEVPQIEAQLEAALRASGIDFAALPLKTQWERVAEYLQSAKREMETWVADAGTVLKATADREKDLRVEVERTLADTGFDASRLKEFQALDQQAALLPSYEAKLKEARDRLASEEGSFTMSVEERDTVLHEQREAFDRVMDRIGREFGGRIQASRADCGDIEPLDRFILALGQRGVTRWWHGLDETRRPNPETLLKALNEGKLNELEMSYAVQETFGEAATKARKRELAAIRCPDRYVLKLQMDDGSYRPLASLSGGQRVSVLLSLLLETIDDRPLIIDQPEDQLDNHFLSETVLPALKRLKGRRQVVVATHNANIVVNGDADTVIQLEATANHGRVALAGTIEEPSVRDAIVRTVDGGDEAFRLRKLKYGF